MVDYDNVLVVYYDRVLVLCEHFKGELVAIDARLA